MTPFEFLLISGIVVLIVVVSKVAGRLVQFNQVLHSVDMRTQRIETNLNSISQHLKIETKHSLKSIVKTMEIKRDLEKIIYKLLPEQAHEFETIKRH